MKKMNIKTLASEEEIRNRNELAGLFRNCPIPDQELSANAGIFEKRQELTKQLFFNQIYIDHILHTHGVIMEFGVRWGQNLVTFNNLRGIYEPYNHNRKIIGFDTFTGFPSIDRKDGNHAAIERGAFNVTENYELFLEKALNFHEKECPLAHIKKNFLVKGDAPEELEKYLKEHPETIIAFAWFDFDIYGPTKKCLELIRPYLVKGSVLGFDELNDGGFPGETIALNESMKLNNIRLKRNRYSGMQSYFIIE